MDLFGLIALLVLLPGVLGLAIRRWWFLPVPALVWGVFAGWGWLAGTFEGDHDWDPEILLLFSTILVLVPAEIAALTGILAGRMRQRRLASRTASRGEGALMSRESSGQQGQAG